MSAVERVRLNESSWTSPVERVRLNESGWTRPVEWVRLNEFGWMTPVERVRLKESSWMSLVEWWQRPRTLPRITLPVDCGIRRTHWLCVASSAYRTDSGSPSMITVADPSVDNHTDCESQRLADRLTVDHTVGVSHRLRITVDDHSRWSFRRRSRAGFLYFLNFVTMLNYFTLPTPSTTILVCCFIYHYFYTISRWSMPMTPLEP